MTAMPVRPVTRDPRRFREMSGRAGWGVLAWIVAIAFFIPVLWMVITAFKPESAAETWPPQFVFRPTLAEFRLVFSGWGPFVTHSVIATVGSTILVLLLGVPASYALAVSGTSLYFTTVSIMSTMSPGFEYGIVRVTPK